MRFGRRSGEPAIQVKIFDVGEVGLLGSSLLCAIRIDECIRQDAKEPRLEVGALFERCKAAVCLEVGLLHQVFSVCAVARHAQRCRIQALGIGHRVASKLRGISHDLHTRFLMLRNEG